MSKKESVARYNLIIKKLRKGPATFEEISGYLELESELQEYDFVISKRTFQRDKLDISTVYNIDIEYCRKRKVYFIEFDQNPEVNERILEAFDTFNALNISDRLSKYIHFEKRKPQGTENLYGLLHAIKNTKCIKFSYQKYWEELPSFRKVEPYALKEFKNRWYILAKDSEDNRIKTFALDRLKDLEITRQSFVYPVDFQISDYFKFSFGIISPTNEKPCDVILSFSSLQGKYIKSLPIHESQEVLIDIENEFRIKLCLYITYDFIMEILSYGKELKVIEPKGLIASLKNTLAETLTLYS